MTARFFRLFPLYLILAPLYLSIAPLAHASSISKPANNLGLVGYWSFDEGTSTVAHDFSGQGNNATLSGSTWSKGKRGPSITFPGSTITDYVQVNPMPFPTAAVSASFWIKTNGSGDGLLSYAVTGSDNEFIIYDQSNITVYANAGSGAATGVSVNDNQWHFVAVTWLASTGAFVLYVDGVNRYSGTYGAGALTSGGCLMFAQEQDSVCGTLDTAQAMPGSLDEVRIYNRVLTSAEVTALYNSGAVNVSSSYTNVSSGLVGWWTFDGADVSGITVRDRTGAGRTGTMHGTSYPRPTTGNIGQALNFDATNSQYINIVNDGSLSLSTGTISAWIRTTNAGSAYRGIFQQTNAYGLYLYNNALATYDNGGGGLRNTGVSLNDGKWHFVAMSFDVGVINGTKLYIDGILSLTTTITPSARNSVMIGEGQGGSTQVFTGDIDDVRAYNRILSAQEIKTIYGEGAGFTSGANNVTGGTLTQGLVGYWSFNGADITDKVYDRVGGNNGYFYGGATSSAKTIGEVGQTLQFNGSTSYVNMGDVLDVGTSNVTITAWIKTTANQDYAGIAGKAYYGPKVGRFSLNTRSGGKLGFITQGSGGNLEAVSSGSLNDGKWHFVTGVLNRTTGIVLYIDGVQDGTTNGDTSGQNFNTADNFTIGYYNNNPSGFLNGAIDEVRVYNRALTASEVKQLYLAGN